MERDPHNLVPSSGVPRLDLVLRLAEALEWTPQGVIDELCRELPVRRGAGPDGQSFDDLDRSAFELQQQARFADLLSVAAAMRHAAVTGAQRATAKLREHAGWEGLGRYTLALAAVQEGLREIELPEAVSLALRTNLANCHLSLGHLDEALALASSLISALHATGPVADAYFEPNLGYLHYIRGSCHRIRAGAVLRTREADARCALGDLVTAQALLRQPASLPPAPVFSGLAKLCEGAVWELRTLIGEVPPETALDAILAELEQTLDPAASTQPSLLEALGWWCVFGCNIALRGPLGSSRIDLAMGVFTNKADELAARLGNWLLRERVWTLELQRREYMAARAGAAEPPSLDSEDARSIIGTMGRFPAFRATGWDILQSSQLSRE
jgi:tetratricopeptide (TPR) repeat protein